MFWLKFVMCVSTESGSAVCEFFMRAACLKGKTQRSMQVLNRSETPTQWFNKSTPSNVKIL